MAGVGGVGGGSVVGLGCGWKKTKKTTRNKHKNVTKKKIYSQDRKIAIQIRANN